MRILWHGMGAHTRTGYGNQTKLFTPAIIDAGYELAINAAIYQWATGTDSNDIINFATGPKYQLMGNDLILGHVDRFKPDIVLSMLDSWICEPRVFDKFAWYPWVFIDSEPLRFENREALKACRKPIAPTRHAQEVLKDAGFDSYYVPLAIDTYAFKPIDRTQARKDMSKVWNVDLKGKFVAVMVSANHTQPSRKNFGAAFNAWSMFEKEHPKSVLYMHTDLRGTSMDGEDLREAMALYKCKNIVFVPQYEYFSGTINEEYLNKVYNAADVFLHTSMGEGFGLPIVEAQAAGCPVIVPDFGNMRELCFSGICASGSRWMYRAGTERFLVDPESVLDCLEINHDEFPNRAMHYKAHSETSAKVQQYSIENVMTEYLIPVLKDIEKTENKLKRKGKKCRKRKLSLL